MKPRDSRKRHIKDGEGNIYVFSLRRFKCPVCGQIHLEIPDCIEPQKHYFKITIEKVISGEINYCTADNKTIYRWKNKK